MTYATKEAKYEKIAFAVNGIIEGTGVGHTMSTCPVTDRNTYHFHEAENEAYYKAKKEINIKLEDVENFWEDQGVFISSSWTETELPHNRWMRSFVYTMM
jgi:hypothetical protein